MARILFVSINDINAEGVRSMSASLKQSGHQAYIIFLKRNGFPYSGGEKYISASKEVESSDWVGINEKGKQFRYSRGPEITAEEKKYLFL